MWCVGLVGPRWIWGISWLAIGGATWAGAPGVKVVRVMLGHVLGECVWVQIPYGCDGCAGHGMPVEVICAGAHNVCPVFCSALCEWFVFMLGQYFCVDVCSIDRASGGPWAAWGS